MHLLEILFDKAISDQRRIAIFTVQNAQTVFFSDISAAIKYSESKSSQCDVYYGLGLVGGNPKGRGAFNDIAAIGGLWADIDMACDVHSTSSLPETLDDVGQILQALGLRPSAIIKSGYGVHAYWFLKEPFIFANNQDRERGAKLAKGWHGLVCSQSSKFGWSLPNLGDITRILRVPGTWNYKIPEKPLPVEIISCDESIRYSIDEIEPLIPKVSDTAASIPQVNLSLRLDVQPPADKFFEAMQFSPKFRDTWNRQRTDLSDQSQSAYDLSLATIAVYLGWSDQEVADLIIAARRKHGQNPEKSQRLNYMQRTIAQARASASDGVILQSPPAPQSVEDDFDDEDEEEVDDPGATPLHLLNVPGFINEVKELTLKTSPHPEPVLAFCGAFSLQAFAAGRKVRDSYDNRTNIYLLGLARSGTGKDQARKINNRILCEVGLSSCTGDTFASGEGIEDKLFCQPSMLFQTDEIDTIINQINKGKDGRYDSIMSLLLKMYSAANSVYPMRVKAGKTDPGIIDQPSLVIFGTATPQHYYEALSTKMLDNGFLARMLILECQKRGKAQKLTPVQIPDSIKRTAKYWAEFKPGTGNMSGFHPEPALVEFSGKAEDLLTEFSLFADQQYDLSEDKNNDAFMSIWARAAEKAHRMALIYSCSENAIRPVISESAVKWATEFVEHMTKRMLFMVHEHASENDFHALCKRLIRVLRQWHEKQGNVPMPLHKLNRKLPWSDGVHEDVRKALENQRLIEYREIKTGGKPQKLYKLTAENRTYCAKGNFEKSTNARNKFRVEEGKKERK
ncbi:MAG: DUF3987 domain-containing protein [Phycisphaerales bacterium]